MSKQQTRYGGVPCAITLLSENENSVIPNKVQVLKCGSFHHKDYGNFKITPEILQKIKANFEAKTRGVDLAIDYAHESDKVAAGWIKNVELSEDGQELWLEVDWTPKGQKVLADKEFRYLSADFAFDYTDNEKKLSHGPTLFGAGLTNRPVIKGMDPVIQLNENENENNPNHGGLDMDQKDQKIAELEQKLKELMAKTESDSAAMGEMQKKLGDYESKAKLDEEQKVLAEKNTKFELLLSEKKAVPAQKEAFIAGDMVKFAELAQPLKLSEQGHGGEGDPAKPTEKTPADEVIELAQAKMKADPKLDFIGATQLVLSENKELKTKYYEQK